MSDTQGWGYTHTHTHTHTHTQRCIHTSMEIYTNLCSHVYPYKPGCLQVHKRQELTQELQEPCTLLRTRRDWAVSGRVWSKPKSTTHTHRQTTTCEHRGELRREGKKKTGHTLLQRGPWCPAQDSWSFFLRMTLETAPME